MHIVSLAPVVVVVAAALAAQQEPVGLDVAELLPPTTVASVDWFDGERLVAAVRAFVRSQEPLPPRLAAGVAILPTLMRGYAAGLDPEELAHVLSPASAALALVAVDGRLEPLLVARVGHRDPDLDRLLDRFAGRVCGSIEDGVLALARAPEHVLRYHRWRRGSAGATLADRAGFRANRPELPGGAGLRVFVDLAALRERQAGPGAFAALDPGARLLLGPIAAVIDRATRLDGVASLGADGARMEATLDASALAAQPARRLLAKGSSRRALPATPDDVLATLALDRSVHGMLSHLDELLGESAAIQARAGVAIADALLAGSVIDDLLPTLDEPATLFVIRADVDVENDPRPVIDLPSFVLVAPLRDPESAQRQLAHLFRTTLTVNTLERRKLGLPVFLLRTGRGPGGEALWVAEPEDWRGPPPPPTALGFSPTLAFGSGCAVLASTRDGADRVLRGLASGQVGRSTGGDLLEVDPAAVTEYVARNLPALVLEEVLDKGVDPTAARGRLEGLAELLSLFSRAAIAVVPSAATTAWRIDLEGGR